MSETMQKNVFYNDSKQKRFYLHRRSLAFCLDLSFILIANKLFSFSLYYLIKSFIYQISLENRRIVIDNFVFIQFCSLCGFFLFYFITSYYLDRGKTLGKSICGLQVISSRGDFCLNFTESCLRTFGHFLTIIPTPVIGILPFLRKDHKSLSDLFAGTQVIFHSLPTNEKKDDQNHIEMNKDIAA